MEKTISTLNMPTYRNTYNLYKHCTLTQENHTSLADLRQFTRDCIGGNEVPIKLCISNSRRLEGSSGICETFLQWLKSRALRLESWLIPTSMSLRVPPSSGLDRLRSNTSSEDRWKIQWKTPPFRLQFLSLNSFNAFKQLSLFITPGVRLHWSKYSSLKRDKPDKEGNWQLSEFKERTSRHGILSRSSGNLSSFEQPSRLRTSRNLKLQMLFGRPSRFLQLSKYKLRRPSRSSIDDGSSFIAVLSKLSLSSFPILRLIFGKLVSCEQPLQWSMKRCFNLWMSPGRFSSLTHPIKFEEKKKLV